MGSITQSNAAVPGLAWVVPGLASALIGALTGAVVLAIVTGVQGVAGKRSP